MNKEIKDDYLWDGSGEPDPEVHKLETVLGNLRHSRPAPEFPEIAMAAARPARRRLLQMRWFRFAVPAVAALVMAAIGLWLLRSRTITVAQTGWEVTRIEGAPRAGTETVNAGVKGTLAVGEVLETDGASKAGINDQETGEIVVEPGTRLRLLANSSGVKRLALEHGTIRATIWAPAGEFVVDTPSAMAVDMGCVYSLHVDAFGNAQLHTTLGWVGFKFGDRESFIPAGAASSTRKDTGPGAPYFEDATDAFRAALSTLDLENGTSAGHDASLRVVLGTARKRDAFTLWHLLSRVPGRDRGAVFDRLAALVPAPSGVSREGVLNLDRQMMDLWWNEFGLGDIALWRHWERSWSQRNAKGK